MFGLRVSSPTTSRKRARSSVRFMDSSFFVFGAVVRGMVVFSFPGRGYTFAIHKGGPAALMRWRPAGRGMVGERRLYLLRALLAALRPA
ncbi:hypothetical protein MVI01_74230 [Myxococcus virescens]|uniref:Uncharacterized protein n=1 Tax=Myxococcus virescens TaxID=83456 RepID=A0A511HT12_9BACT|nr:hypothetical protein MVI01_74230 [Myxococcus virescens]